MVLTGWLIALVVVLPSLTVMVVVVSLRLDNTRERELANCSASQGLNGNATRALKSHVKVRAQGRSCGCIPKKVMLAPSALSKYGHASVEAPPVARSVAGSELARSHTHDSNPFCSERSEYPSGSDAHALHDYVSRHSIKSFSTASSATKERRHLQGDLEACPESDTYALESRISRYRRHHDATNHDGISDRATDHLQAKKSVQHGSCETLQRSVCRSESPTRGVEMSFNNSRVRSPQLCTIPETSARRDMVDDTARGQPVQMPAHAFLGTHEDSIRHSGSSSLYDYV